MAAGMLPVTLFGCSQNQGTPCALLNLYRKLHYPADVYAETYACWQMLKLLGHRL